MINHRVVSMAEFNVEEDRLIRLRGMIQSHGADPSCILETLHIVVTGKDWRKCHDSHGGNLTFRGYIKAIGWDEAELLSFVERSKHSREKGKNADPAIVVKMEELRKALRESISPLGILGTNQYEEEGGVSNTNSKSRELGNTSPDYILARLARDASESNEDEEDRRFKAGIRERVISGAISPGRAAIEAGWRQEVVQIPKDPIRAARAILRHFQGERLESLIRELRG